ncbi:terpene synthase [Asanoa sp. WMMD1127]|uniref:terpene synthase family protein n=1 Tax=Asanoa sp. WMMD1127 TaxID=3016107 RepID=UPI002416CBE3|nr:terpene synthase [Asanoa sp. WMMD1127]MDG4821654.1 terpene synthase [Asanoa sp. WMMD1127]
MSRGRPTRPAHGRPLPMVTPGLFCPIPPRISPHADDVQDWLTGWLVDRGVPVDTAERLRGAGFARYAGRLYPDANAPDLRLVTALFTWFFLLDDTVDSSAAPPLERVRATVDGVYTTIDSDGRTPAPGLPEPMRAMLLDSWREITAGLSEMSVDRITDALRHHLDGILVEASNKWVGRRPGIVEYIQLRRATSAAYVSYALIEFAAGLRTRIPEAVYHHPVLREISAAGNDLLSWFNDLLSLERDENTAVGHNLVLATARERGLSRDAAITEVIGRWQERMTRFVELRAAVPAFGARIDVAVRRYVEGVADSVRGTIDWSLESPRYPLPTIVEDWVSPM